MTKAHALFLTESQIAERMGLSAEQFKVALPALKVAGFPEPDPLFCKRRYWPACEAFLDRRYGLTPAIGSRLAAVDGEEHWS